MCTAGKTHNEDLILIKSCLKIFGYCICIIQEIFKCDGLFICFAVICDPHIAVIPINYSKLVFQMHILILVSKDIIICTGAAGNEEQNRIIRIPAVNEEPVRSSVNVHYKLFRNALRIIICPYLPRAHQCPYYQNKYGHQNNT